MKITFHGGIREIGGSCIVVDTDDTRVALDYGMNVEEGLSNDMPGDLDAVVVTHAHLDHSGNLLGVADRETVVIGSEATKDITLELLKDLIKVHRMNRKPIPYRSYHVSKLSSLWLNRERTGLPGMNISLYPAGHVLGANMVQIEAQGKTLLYTGDFSIQDTEILDGADPQSLPKEPDALIMESTYGGTLRPPRSDLVKALFGEISETMERKGNILVPTFAFHRLQEMARRIDLAFKEKLLPSYNAYYISGLAQRITYYYHDYKDLLSEQVRNQSDPFHYTKVKPSRRTEDIREPAIVICTSGFGHAGASRALLMKWAGNEEDAIIINTGYLPPTSPLTSAKEGRIENNGESIEVNADVEQIELSGHADQGDLMELVKTLKPKKTFLVHGTLDQAQALSEKIEKYTEVQIPDKHDSFNLT